jgi:gliding motility-associated-like protein
MRKAFLYISILISIASFAQENVVTPHVSPALRFTENIGQWDDNILFKASLDGGALFVERNTLTFNFYDKKKYRSFHHGKQPVDGKDLFYKGHVYKMNFVGANLQPKVEKMQEGSDYENFYLDSDPKRWKSGVRNYHQIWLRNLYNQIDYEAITAINGIKYNFHVKPEGSPSDIKIKYEGVDDIKLKDGALILKLEVNEVVEQKPYAYQLINGVAKMVPCKYVFKNKTLSFEFPLGYNTKYDLVIDPILVFSAQIGVTPDNFGMTATFDAAGNLYSGGMVYNVNYAVTPGAYSSSFIGPAGYGRSDIFITKFNSTGNALLYSTYLGGAGSEEPSSLIVDFNNNLCLYGCTSSPNFPMTAGAAYNFFKGGPNIAFASNAALFCGGTDIYIAKFNANGTALLASTYYGGTHNDGINYLTSTFNISIAASNNPCATVLPTTNYDSLQTNYGDQFRGEIQVDMFNNIYIASSTRSSDLPMVGGFDNSHNGGQDAFVAKFNPGLTNLIYSSFIGGSQNDCGNGIYISNSQEVYLTGGTCSSNLLGTSGGHEPSYKGGKTDGFLYKINSAGNSIVNATYIGTNDYDNAFFVHGDKNGKIYVYGQSYGNMPILKAATSPTVFNVPNTHQFIMRYDNNLANINMATVFGSKTVGVDISPSAFAVDKCNNIYLSGWGGGIITNTVAMVNMPLASPTQSTTNGYDFYLMGLDSNANNLIYGSYHGGVSSSEHVDGGTSRFDSRGVIYQSVCAGCGGADDFPRTPFTWPCPLQATGNCPNQNPSTNCNNGVFKINFQLLIAVSTINTNTASGCNPLTVNFTNGTPPTGAGASSTWYFGNGQVVNTTSTTIAVTYTNPGTYTVSLVVIDPAACNEKDSSITFITVHPNVSVAATATHVPCSDTVLYNGPAITTGTLSTYQWTFAPGGSLSTSTLTSPINNYSISGTYTAQILAITNMGCRDSSIVSININTLVPTVTSNTICQGASGGITAGGGTSYSWTPSTGLSNPNIANPIANPTITTTYTVIVTNTLTGCTRTLTSVVTVNPKPTADFNFITNPCGGGVNFIDNSASNITQWFWNFGNLQTSTLQNPYQFYNPGGTFSVSLVAGNAFNCYDTIVKQVTVGNPPPVTISSTQTICLGGFVTLNATGGISYQWSPTVSLINPTAASPIATPTITTQYSVVITTTSSLGTCTVMLTTDVIVTQASAFPISATANPSVVDLGNSSVLTLSASPTASVTWYPIGSTAPINGYTVNATPPYTTTYTVVIQRGPCIDTALVRVEVIEFGCFDTDVFVPNTFTPNGDGINDIMYARGHKLAEVYFAIYNRWGEMVFETTDIKTGWDGNYKGRPADVGVFGYYVKIKCINGGENFRKGNITLIR